MFARTRLYMACTGSRKSTSCRGSTCVEPVRSCRSAQGQALEQRTRRPLPSPFCPPSRGSPEDDSCPWLNCFVNSRLSCACHDGSDSAASLHACLSQT